MDGGFASALEMKRVGGGAGGALLIAAPVVHPRITYGAFAA